MNAPTANHKFPVCFTHYCKREPEPWLAIHRETALEMLKGYNLTHEQKSDVFWPVAPESVRYVSPPACPEFDLRPVVERPDAFGTVALPAARVPLHDKPRPASPVVGEA